MYDWELTKYLQDRNYVLTPDEYMFICKTCPQLTSGKYEPFGNYFEFWSSDGNYYKFQVFNNN